MYIPNDDTQNYSYCRFKLVVETFEHSTYLYNTMANKLMNITNEDTQNYPFYRLKLVVETFNNQLYNQPIKIY